MNKKKLDLNSLLDLTIKSDIKKVSPSQMSENQLSDEIVTNIVETLSDSFGIKNNVITMSAIFLLFLKGAANAGTPNTIEIEVIDDDGKKVSITKNDLLYAYNRHTNNKFLRRLAETLAPAIGKYAESNQLSGDIAEKINTKILSKKPKEGEVYEPILSSKERAWCNSFGQNIPDLAEISSRLPRLLAEDYLSRFSKPKKKRNQFNEKPLPIRAPLQKKDRTLFKNKPNGGDE